MTPVRTSGAMRRLGVMVRRWDIALRMWEMHDDADIWFTESSKPGADSPWAKTSAHELANEQIGPVLAIHIAAAEAQLRLDAVHDYFKMLRAATTSRSAYSLYVLCRATVEACAFSTWVFDPTAEPGERLLRGLLLRKRALEQFLRSLRKFTTNGECDAEPAYVASVAEAYRHADAQLCDVERAIRRICADLVPSSTSTPGSWDRAPSATDRIRHMLCDDLDLPQGFDAYHRMSGVAHSEAIGIIGTWNAEGGKPSIDYYNFLEPLHLALCSIHFALQRRSDCWGETYRAPKLHKIIGRVEHIIEREPGVQMG